MRSNMLEVMHEEFVTMARMKGLSEWRIVIGHAARNALLPVVTAFALGVGLSMGGNVVIETVFSLARHRPHAGAGGVGPRLSAGPGRVPDDRAVLAIMNFVADLLYMTLDPRVSHGRTG